MKVIITSAETRRGFDVFNIIKNKHKYEVILCSSGENVNLLKILYSHPVNYLRKNNFDLFSRDLTKILAEHLNSDLVFMPVSEEHILMFFSFIKENPSKRLKFLLPTEENFNLCRNKILFQNFCENFDFPVPKSFKYNELLISDFNEFPIVFKKAIGAGSIGLKYINDKSALLDFLNYNKDSSYIIQQKISGNGEVFGAFYLCKNGKVIGYHGHKRIRTYPTNGGVTVCSKADYSDELKNIGGSLIEKLNWNGFAMIEFMFDTNTQKWKIIELNPRLWGSLLLTEFSDSKFVENYINICLDKEPVESQFDKDTYIKWFFPFELINYFNGKISFTELFNIKREKICYINFTYGKKLNVLLFNLYMLFNLKSVLRFVKKSKRNDK